MSEGRDIRVEAIDNCLDRLDLAGAKARDEEWTLDGVGVECSQCGGELYMVTCDFVHRTGHDSALASLCFDCRNTHRVEGGCPDCGASK